MSESQEYSTGPLLKPAEANARMSAEQASETEPYTLGVQTVIWGMQWVKAGAALRFWGTPLPAGKEHLAIDPVPHGYTVWGQAKELLTHELKILETPNTQTLYSIAVLDLDESGPVVLQHPDHKDRYFHTSIWDVYGETYPISQRKDGSTPEDYLLAPRHWQGEPPAGMQLIRIRSRLVIIGPHIAVYGDEDIPNVHALQAGYKMIPLKNQGKGNESLAQLDPNGVIHPLVRPDTKTPPDLLFFEMLGETLKDIYELRPDEEAFARQVERIGITRIEVFDFENLDSAATAVLNRALLDAQSIIEHRGQRIATQQEGGSWMVPADLASLDDWLLRAAVGWKFVWGELKSEVLYPQVRTDADSVDVWVRG